MGEVHLSCTESITLKYYNELIKQNKCRKKRQYKKRVEENTDKSIFLVHVKKPLSLYFCFADSPPWNEIQGTAAAFWPAKRNANATLFQKFICSYHLPLQPNSALLHTHSTSLWTWYSNFPPSNSKYCLGKKKTQRKYWATLFSFRNEHRLPHKSFMKAKYKILFSTVSVCRRSYLTFYHSCLSRTSHLTQMITNSRTSFCCNTRKNK